MTSAYWGKTGEEVKTVRLRPIIAEAESTDARAEELKCTVQVLVPVTEVPVSVTFSARNLYTQSLLEELRRRRRNNERMRLNDDDELEDYYGDVETQLSNTRDELDEMRAHAEIVYRLLLTHVWTHDTRLEVIRCIEFITGRILPVNP